MYAEVKAHMAHYTTPSLMREKKLVQPINKKAKCREIWLVNAFLARFASSNPIFQSNNSQTNYSVCKST